MAIKEVVFELKLFVDGKQAAESTDFTLWQSVYRVIKHAKGEPGDITVEAGLVGKDLVKGLVDESSEVEITEFANMLGLDVPTLKGACDPKKEEPFIHLDMHCWANWTKNLPKRGPGSMSATPLVATLLALWFRTAELGTVTLQLSQKVLKDIGVEDKHPKRSINNCEWLQLRSGKAIQVNASAIDKAIEVAKAFCEKRKPKLTSK